MSQKGQGVRPIIAWTEPATAGRPSVLYLDGDPCTAPPRGRAWRSVIAYHVGAMDHATLESWLEPGDNAYASKAGLDRSYTYRSGGHTFRLVHADAWGLPGTVEGAGERLTHLRSAIADEGWKWGLTASTIAGRILTETAAPPGQLPPRWRAIAHDAIHQGPVAVIRGGGADVTAVDRSAAFLHGLRESVGLSWTSGLKRWTNIRRGIGLVFATVRVASCDLPPLPVRRGGGTLYPFGRFAGVWTIAQLAAAEVTSDVEVEEVHEAAVAVESAPYYVPCANRIQHIDDKILRKLAYTRFWGRLARLGGWEGTPERPAGTADQWRGSSLWWTWTGHGGMSHKCPPDYRPDHAAAIAGQNSCAMLATVRTVPAGQLVAAHVDCLWIDGPVPTLAGAWKVKGRGPFRAYAPGVYVHGDTLAASGRSVPPTTAADVESWARTGPGGGWAAKSRDWLSDTCVESISASSLPIRLDDDEGRRLRYDLTGQPWTARGWIYAPKEVEHEPDPDQAGGAGSCTAD